MRKEYELIPLASFFWLNADWYQAVATAHSSVNDTVSYCTELWEDIIFHLTNRIPISKDDPLWDEVLVNQQQLRNFSVLKRKGFFTKKAP